MSWSRYIRTVALKYYPKNRHIACFAVHSFIDLRDLLYETVQDKYKEVLKTVK